MCIKSGELELALDVYSQMRSEGVTPNLVTFNTLIDVYGKTGQWEEAVRVLDTLEQQARQRDAAKNFGTTINITRGTCLRHQRACKASLVKARC